MLPKIIPCSVDDTCKINDENQQIRRFAQTKLLTTNFDIGFDVAEITRAHSIRRWLFSQFEITHGSQLDREVLQCVWCLIDDQNCREKFIEIIMRWIWQQAHRRERCRTGVHSHMPRRKLGRRIQTVGTPCWAWRPECSGQASLHGLNCQWQESFVHLKILILVSRVKRFQWFFMDDSITDDSRYGSSCQDLSNHACMLASIWYLQPNKTEIQNPKFILAVSLLLQVHEYYHRSYSSGSWGRLST